MIVSMIAAMDRNRVIGQRSGGIPWQLGEDSQHFRNYTQGKAMLIGRSSFAEMDGWFTTQTPLVLTRSLSEIDGARVCSSVVQAIETARGLGHSELVVSGGASVYRAALAHANRLVLTHIDTVADVADPVHFPEYKNSDWREHSRREFPKTTERLVGFSIIVLCPVDR